MENETTLFEPEEIEVLNHSLVKEHFRMCNAQCNVQATVTMEQK